jgi:hypothetical protein
MGYWGAILKEKSIFEVIKECQDQKRNKGAININPKEFFSKWKQGMLNLTPMQQLQGKMVGFLGGAFGLFLAMITLLLQRSWGFSIFVFFLIWLQIINYIGTRQQFENTKNLFVDVKNIEGKENGL